MIWILHKILKSGGIYKMYNKYLNTQITGSDIPKHVGIILDGRGREINFEIKHNDRVNQIIDWSLSTNEYNEDR